MTCISCSVNTKDKLGSSSKLIARTSINNGLKQRLSSISSLKIKESIYRIVSCTLSSDSNIKTKENVSFGLKEELVDTAIGNVKAYNIASFGLKPRISSVSNLKNTKTDKFAGSPVEFAPSEKLYPIDDISFLSKNTGSPVSFKNYFSFLDVELPANIIYSSIDEGIFIGNYTKNNQYGSLISDDSQSLVFVSQMLNDGGIEFKFEVTTPVSVAKFSYFAIRASAPFDNYTERKTQKYKISNIVLRDPNNNIIIQYNDIYLRGDNNFTTYIATPQINNLLLPTWHPDYPFMEEDSGYTLTFNLFSECVSYPFDNKFDLGYEQSCIQDYPNVSDNTSLTNLRISAIEIGNGGGIGILRDNYLNLNVKVTNTTNKIERILLPNQFLPSNFDNGIYPNSISVWKSEEGLYDNTTSSGCDYLLNSISNSINSEYIKLISSSLHPDSGKLILKFDTTPRNFEVDRYINGAFNFGSKDVNRAELTNYNYDDNYFDIDELELRILARKSANTPDFVFDVVGYSDDKLLNVTPKVGGFLQNAQTLTNNSQYVPDISGFKTYTPSISDGSFSDGNTYYQKDISSKGDHYILAQSPVINTTNLKEYTIPLEIFQDANKLGLDKYSLSSFFENLYLDIGPLPSGTIIKNISMVVKYRPSAAFNIHTFGGPINVGAKRKSTTLMPSSSGTINSNVRLSGILTGYKTPPYLYSNYSRRWRGLTGDVLSGGDFAYSNFDFSFNHLQSDTPFLTSYIDFTNIDNTDIYDNKNNLVGQSAISLDVLSNFGWRYSSDQLIDGITTDYKSISWSNNIFDFFDRSIRISSNNSLEYYGLNNNSFDNSGNPDNKLGFALFIRFTPDKVSSNDLNNSVIFTYENFTDYSLALISENGFLKLKIRNIDDDIITISDTLPISNYQFPLPVLITFNDDGFYNYKLYTDNVSNSLFTNLRATSATVDTYILSDNPALHIGFSQNYTDVPSLPIFIHEIGCSNAICNIIESNPNRFLNQITAKDLFDSYKALGSNIDDDISKWKLGDFKICHFSSDFDSYTKRNGKDFLIFNLNHHGSGYTQFTDLPLPSNINLSGVSYHSQIENDFLRFDLADVPYVDQDRFYSTSARISKTLPKGYLFQKNSICVESILEHEASGDLLWNNGLVGPKLIVSLYTNAKNSLDRPSKDFGLVLRDTHYLDPSDCTQKIISQFSDTNLFDTSEPWSIFDKESYLEEFNDKYDLFDINAMFLQYDLVYPSGNSFSSKVKLHSSNIKLNDSVYLGSGVDTLVPLNMVTSGDKYQDTDLKLHTFCNTYEIYDSGFALVTSGNKFNSLGYLNLIIDNTTNWKFGGETDINLYVRGLGAISTFENTFGSDLFGSSNFSLPLHTICGPIGEEQFPLCMLGDSNPNTSILLYVNGENGRINDSINFITLASPSFVDYFPSSSTTLFINSYLEKELNNVNNSINLYTQCDNASGIIVHDSINLFALNYPLSPALADKKVTIQWDSKDTGSSITVLDNVYSSLNANDNIRGVDLMCYGDCLDSSKKCTETVLDVHGVQWYYPEVCVDGGISRAKTTYTNLDTNISFSGIDGYSPLPYSGHFYDIRKYSGLAPKLPYVITITGKTGSTDSIKIPDEILEVEYNKLSDDSTMNYDGLRLTANSNYRTSGNEFGKSLASKEDLLAIGSPKINLEYTEDSESYTLQEAGAVFLYRRSPRPNGYSWPNDQFKSNWSLEEVLTLPSGMLKDYGRREEIANLYFPENLKPYQTRWVVGQDGRQFGHSVDISINNHKKSLGENSKQIVVVGGTSARWNRQFDDTEPSGVSIGLILFTDEFTPRVPRPTRSNPFNTVGYEQVLDAIKDKDLVFNYFSQPRIKFDVKLIICRPLADNSEIVQIDYNTADKPDFITLKTISRNKFPRTQEQTDKILSGIKDAFFTAFPHDTGRIHNNIPPILGIYVDSSQSLTSRALEPALSEFTKFYKEYSYASGLRDFYGVQDSGIVVNNITSEYAPEDWVEMSTTILSQVLDTGNLVSNNRVRFLTNNVGTFNNNLANFNIPPESGGKVYIFEKESGNWNLIQEIKSPNVTYSHPDRFGHSVSISDNGEVIAIGSPYISQAVTIYELKQDQKDILYSQVYNWVLSKYPEKYKNAILEFENSSQRIESAQLLYLRLDKEHKFECRLDNNIQEYQIVHTFDYTNMQPKGSWTFIPEVFAPTSRLGYSVDVNEDGSIVVAGAPTDSLNPYNDADVYYVAGNQGGKNFQAYYSGDSSLQAGSIKPSWSSSVNAGSVHIFESRKYYPHNKVIEYGKFGNLHQLISDHTPDSGHFNYLSSIFSDKNFEKTDFTDVNIPNEAGLVFIITPKEDALSDEIFNNIVNWLSLGDRNLVLVGNDPIWEASGIYQKSNTIINKILERLNSRMRLTAARNIYESLPNGYTTFNNIIPSLIPQGCTETYTSRLPLRGSGVGDIRIYYPGFDESMTCDEVTLCDPDSEPVQLQTRCEMPLRHYGDLRAQWNVYCCKSTPNGYAPVIYKKNWPLVFGSYAPDCSDQIFEDNPTKNQEPIPLLVASEKVTEEIIYPTIPEQYITENILQEIEIGTLYFRFGEPENNNLIFAWDSGNNIYNSLNTNFTNKISDGLFYKPEFDGILQAKAIPASLINTYSEDKVVSDHGYFAIEQEFDATKKSKIIVISSVDTESQEKLYGSFLDQNIKFYINLVSKTSFDIGGSKIGQLGAWTGRTSFRDGNPTSILKSIFLNDNAVVEDVDTSFYNISRPSLDSTFDVAWVANINSQPSDQELEDLKSWLRYGDKKLIITCGYTTDSVRHAELLSQKLGVNIGPLFLPYAGQYASVSSNSLFMNQNHPVAGNDNQNNIEEYVAQTSFYALEKRNKNSVLAYDLSAIFERVPAQSTTDYWNMSAGTVKLSVPVEAGSGYKIFITTSSDSFAEQVPINVNIENAVINPNLPFPTYIGGVDLQEINKDSELSTFKTIPTSVNTITCGGSETKTVDIQVAEDKNEINIYLSSELIRFSNDKTYIPKTVKLVGISGVKIPIVQTTSISKTYIPTNEFKITKISDAKPEERTTIDVIRPISTDNTKYCTPRCTFLGNQLIDDGPVVAAQELEFISSFDAGFARSRITLLSDSSMLQGRQVSDQDGSIPTNTFRFIRSLYPDTIFDNFTTGGRQFNIYNKIISPERGSPTKYYINSHLGGINKYFGNSGSSSYDKLNEHESEYIFKNVIRPDVPWKDEITEDKIQEIKNTFISGFLNNQILHASTARFSGIIDGTMYSDASVGGGLPQLLKDKGYDYLDFDKLPSGYPGDLFGYSVCVKENKIAIGSPFSAFPSEDKNIWSSGWYSGVSLHIANDGGAGAVYLFAKTSGNRWLCDQKLRPNILMGQLSGVNESSDQFGHSIGFVNDVIAIGSPNHKYNNYIDISHEGSFIRKSFNDEFDITIRSAKDLSDSGIRSQHSDNPVHNAGAIYVYENKITDWENKKQSLVLIEKVLSNSPSPSGERFGKTIYLSRPYRSDADYTIFAGCQFASGNDVLNIGASYTKDIMLRGQSPVMANPNSWISAKVFGDRDTQKQPTVQLAFSNNGFSNKRYFADGVIRPNENGDIFIEVSGQDLSNKGFIAHRPYIESVLGHYKYGKLLEDSLTITIDAINIPPSSYMPLIIDVENSAPVYNTIGLYSNAVSGISSSELCLYTYCPQGVTISDSISLYSSGAYRPEDIINLAVRGK